LDPACVSFPTGHGGYAGLAASGGTAYPLWIDTSGTREEEVYSVNLPAEAFGR
jgi:hypothetical protein